MHKVPVTSRIAESRTRIVFFRTRFSLHFEKKYNKLKASSEKMSSKTLTPYVYKKSFKQICINVVGAFCSLAAVGRFFSL